MPTSILKALYRKTIAPRDRNTTGRPRPNSRGERRGEVPPGPPWPHRPTPARPPALVVPLLVPAHRTTPLGFVGSREPEDCGSGGGPEPTHQDLRAPRPLFGGLRPNILRNKTSRPHRSNLLHCAPSFLSETRDPDPVGIADSDSPKQPCTKVCHPGATRPHGLSLSPGNSSRDSNKYSPERATVDIKSVARSSAETILTCLDSIPGSGCTWRVHGHPSG